MSDAWRSYAGAPENGTIICASSDISDGYTKCLVLRADGKEFPLLLIRRDGIVRGFINACPHQYLPLNYRSDAILSTDGARLLCTAHDATFDVESGKCLSAGLDGLDAVPVADDENGNIVIRERQ